MLRRAFSERGHFRKVKARMTSWRASGYLNEGEGLTSFVTLSPNRCCVIGYFELAIRPLGASHK